MGIRRRRRKLTTLMSRLDQRVKSVELRPITLLTQDQITAAVNAGETPASQDPTTVIAIDAPRFVKVVDAIAYPAKYTGTTDLVEIYLEADIEAAKGDRIEVSGIHGRADADLDASGDNFTVTAVDTPPWTGRVFKNGKVKHDPADTAWSTVTNVYQFKPETAVPTTWSGFKRLQTRKKVDSYTINGSTVTLTLNSAHKFQQGEVFFVDIFAEDSRAYGIDGLFRITSVTSNTIVYTLDAGVDTPVPSTVPAADVFVYPVAKKFLAVGSTWADSSNNKIYYWDGIRWVDYSLVADPVRDGDPPAAPTGLNITSVGIVSTNVSIPTAQVTLSWTAPTKTKSGKDLEDLVGYKIRWRRTTGEDWRVKDVRVKNATSYTFEDDVTFKQGTLYYFELYAYDSGLQDSDPVTKSHTTAIKTSPLSSAAPTAPIIESKLGTMTVKWDGLLATTPLTSPPADVLYLKIHRSTVSGFTPSNDTLISTISAVENNYAIFSDVEYNTDYYFKFVLIDTSGVQSLPSTQAAARVTPLVNTDLLVANVLNSWSFAGNLISAGALANGAINAASLLGPNVVTQNAISANAIGANQIAAGAIIAGKIGADAVTANTVAANAIYAGAIQANAIEADKIKVGALDGKLITGATVRTSGTNPRVEMNSTGLYAYNSGGGLTFRILSSDGSVYIASGVQIGGYATTGDVGTVSAIANAANNNASNANTTAQSALSTANGKLGPGQAAADVNQYANVTTIDGGAITTGTLDANRIKADSILGGTIRTATSGARIEIRGRDNPAPGIVGFKSSGTAFRFYSNGMSYLDDVIADTVSVTGSITGGTIRTASTYPRVQLDASTNSVRGRYTSTLDVNLIAQSWGMFVDSGFSVSGIATGTTAAYDIVAAPFSGVFVRGGLVSSDARLKTNISNSPLGLDFVNQLQTVEYTWKTDKTGSKNIGVIAQEVKQVLDDNYPEFSEYFVKADGAGLLPGGENAYGVNYNKFIPVLLNAVKELSSQVSELKSEIATLKENR